MKRCLVAMMTLVLVAVLAVGCAGAPSAMPTPTPSPTPTPTGENVNFRLLISDEVVVLDPENDYVEIRVMKFWLHQVGGEVVEGVCGEDGEGTVINLAELPGLDAVEVWNGHVPPGDYNKVFLYIGDYSEDEHISANIGGEDAEVKLPSDKLQISKPFIVPEEGEVNFVYDITVVKAGNSSKYILKPQLTQSGTAQEFRLVNMQGKTERHTERHEEKHQEEHGKPVEPGELNLEIVEGDIAPTAPVILKVSLEDGQPVEGATVTVNGDKVMVTVEGEETEAETDANGLMTIILPDTSGEVKIKVSFEDMEGELELELEEEESTE